VYEGVSCVADEFPYGPHFRETMDVLVPCASSRALRGPLAVLYDLLCLACCYPVAAWHYLRRRVLRRELREIAGARGFPALCFVHGGGWVAIDASLQHHQSTALARALGAAIYTINYPHAPESAFPHSTLSTLRALRFLREEQGHAQVTLVGESAGGNLVTVVAGLLSDRALLEDFCRRCRDDYGFTAPKDDPRRWSFPDVVACVSWYGICDVEAWVGAGWLWRGLNWVYDCHKGDSELPPVLRHGPDFRWALSRSAQDMARRKARHEDPFMTVACMARHFALREYPPLLLTAGATDPLGLLHSSEEAYQALSAHFPARPAEGRLLRAYHDATHAFIGLNPFILYAAQGALWRDYAQVATDETIEFLRMHVPAFAQRGVATCVASGDATCVASGDGRCALRARPKK
jgi:acetyl esterase/lipase